MESPVSKRSIAFRIKLLGLFVALAGAGIWLAAYSRLNWPARFAVVEQGRLYRSSQPSTRQLGNMIESLGVRTLVIARSGNSDRVPDEIDYAKSKGLSVVHLPIESQRPVPEEQVRDFFATVDNPEYQPVLVHCSAGRHRTGYLCARYRVDRQGWTVEKAVDELLSFGFDTVDQKVVLDQLKAYKPVNTERAAVIEGKSVQR